MSLLPILCVCEKVEYDDKLVLPSGLLVVKYEQLFHQL